MDQKQQNTKAHLVLGSLIEMEDTEKSHIVKILKVNYATITVANWIVTHDLNTTYVYKNSKSNTRRQVHIYMVWLMTQNIKIYTSSLKGGN